MSKRGLITLTICFFAMLAFWTLLFIGISHAGETASIDCTHNCDCPPGPPGPRGPQGPPGPPGHNGSDGPPGHDGHNGSDGPPGHDGRNGQDGSDGHDGSNGRNGVNGQAGDNGGCIDCLEDRINMGDAVIASLQSPYIRTDKRMALNIGLGGMEDQKAIGIGAALRLTNRIYVNGSVGTNLDEVCNDESRCIDHYDQFELVGWKIHLNIEF